MSRASCRSADRDNLIRLSNKYQGDKSANLARIVATCERIAEWGAVPREVELDLIRWSKAYATACCLIDLCGRALAKSSAALIADDCVQSEI